MALFKTGQDYTEVKKLIICFYFKKIKKADLRRLNTPVIRKSYFRKSNWILKHIKVTFFIISSENFQDILNGRKQTKMFYRNR